MVEFFSQAKIKDANKLFGREDDLHKLLGYASDLTQIQIVGCRRFGKTTISMCVENELRSNPDSHVYPIYTDVKTESPQGTANFYRYLISKLVVRISTDGIFTEEKKFGRVTIQPCDNYKYVIEDLKEAKDAFMDDTFKKLVSFVAEKLQKTVLYIFDEYEHMAENTIDSLDGFMPLRDFSTERLESGIRPFFFWLVGARPWGEFVKEKRLSNVEVIGGSGEFNNVEIAVPLVPISKSAFTSFWNTRCEEYYSQYNDDLHREEKELLLSYEGKVYDAISGVPYFALSLAKYIRTEKTFPSYFVEKSHLDELVQMFSDSTVSLMRSLCSPKVVVENDDYNTLDQYGLISCDEEGKCIISMGFLRDFLIANNTIDDTLTPTEPAVTTDKRDQIERLLDKINACIYNINETCRNKKHDPIFIPTGDDRDNDKRILRVCTSEEEFGQLLVTLTKIYYERSKKLDGKGNSIPGQALAELEATNQYAYKNRKFFQVLETLRTYYGAHLKDTVERKNDYQLGIGEALLELQGHKNEPDSPEQWFHLQIKMLQLFLIELNTVKQKVNNLPDSHKPQIKETVVEEAKPSVKILGKIELPKLAKTSSKPEVGKTYTGVYTKATNKVKSDVLAYPYEVRTKNEELYDCADVEFEFDSEPNNIDPMKTYFFAINVRLK